MEIPLQAEQAGKERAILVVGRRGIRYDHPYIAALGRAARLELFLPESLDEMSRRLPVIAEDFDEVAVFGGDGTAHQVINAVGVKGKRFIIVPIGSGNDFAATLGLQNCSPARLASVVERGQYSSVDIIQAETYLEERRTASFCVINSVGYGFDTQTLKLRESLPKIFERGYLFIFLLTIATLNPFRVTAVFELPDPQRAGSENRILPLKIDSEAAWVLGMNTKRIGGGLPVAPRASVEDGLLDLLVVKWTSRWDILKNTIKIRKAAHINRPSVMYEQVPQITFHFESPREELACDGEIRKVRFDRLQLRTLKGALTVLSGPGYASKEKNSSLFFP